jgi:ATP diphosphatase
MIRRHPHVFGSEAERAAGVAPGFWDKAKAAEKKDKPASGILDDVPVTLPALTRAIKLQNKAAKVGFDWPSLAPVFAKLNEEIAELEEAIATTDNGPNRAAIEEEFGDLLFVVANVARHLKLDPEAALRAANDKFARRFRYIEAQLASRSSSPAQSNLAEMDELWNEAKANER